MAYSGIKGLSGFQPKWRYPIKEFSVLYHRWRDMKKRCYDKNKIGYHRYGGRGIIVCDEWLNNFDVYVEFCLSHNWKRELQIDRIDNDGNYEPENCRFVTHSDNQRNRIPTEKKLRSTKRAYEMRKKPVRCLETGRIFDSTATASRWLKLNVNAVNYAIRNRWRAGGYNWVYI